MRELIPLTDEEIEAQFSAIGAELTVDDLVFTRDTVDDFKSARHSYRESGKVELSAPNKLVVLGLQVAHSRSRTDLYVVDFGEVRAAYSS